MSYALTQFKDKINFSFKVLRATGIQAKSNFSCCNSCATFELCDNRKDSEKLQKKYKGFCFYHQQEASSLKRLADVSEDLSVLLNFGSFEDDKISDAEVAKSIIDVLKNQGLKVTWNGDVSQKILVANY